MPRRSTAGAVAIAAVAGAAIWYATAILTARREPWDATAYWVVAYPIAIAVCAVLGYRYPDRPWRWALVLFWSQFLAMGVRNGELGGLWPLGLVMFGVIAVPGIVAARVAARFGRDAALQ